MLEEEELEDNRTRLGEMRDFVQSTTGGGRLQVGTGPSRGLCDACALFCSYCQSHRVHPAPSPALSSSPVGRLGSPCLCGCDSSVPFGHSSCVLEVK